MDKGIRKKNLQQIRPLRLDAATLANAEAMVAKGYAADISAALRVGVAIAGRLDVGDPAVYVVSPGSNRIFGLRATAEAWLVAQGARQVGEDWIVYDEDDDPETFYQVEKVVPL